MTNKLVSELANIDFYPSFFSIEEGYQITIGDLHGNALKLLHFIVKHGVVECSQAQYDRFVELYRKETSFLTELDLSEMKAICNELTIKNKAKICLIGDELADRGQNDYFTLLLINKLKKESVPIDILLSNHGFTFIECMENGGLFRSELLCGNRKFGRSMHQMQDLIDEKKLNSDEISTMAQDSYLPNLKLLSYTITSHDEITYYSHAKIDEEVIENLARTMGVPYYANTVFQLAATIDAINNSFQKNYVQNKLVHTLALDLSSVGKNDPITFLMWNRNYEILKNIPHSFKMNEVHGHDSNGPTIEGVYCLNNTLGFQLDCHTGEYHVLVSSLAYHTKNLVLVNTEKTQLEPVKIAQENSLVNDFFSNLLLNANNPFHFGCLSPVSFFGNRYSLANSLHFDETTPKTELTVSS